MEQLWQIRSAFGDAFRSDMFNETETFTKALQKSFSAEPLYESDFFAAEMVESLFSLPEISAVPTPTLSGGSENDNPHASKQRRVVTAGGRVTKRKTRLPKRAATLFIATDPSNFRQMVQQVTGGSFGGLNGLLPVHPVTKPEAQRAVHLSQHGSYLPTLDSSDFLLEGPIGQLAGHFPPPSAAANDFNAPPVAARLDSDSVCGFPTLESWNVA